jgi:hypothetical protein
VIAYVLSADRNAMLDSQIQFPNRTDSVRDADRKLFVFK